MTRERIREKPLVSIIVTIYNKQQYVRQCIDSIVAQTYGLIEIILVDDGSTDDSGRICDDYAEKDNRVEVLHKTNGGLISAWTAGVELSRGDYLVFVDSDDWLDPEMTERLVAESSFGAEPPEQDDSHAEIICCNAVFEYPDGKKGYEPHAAEPGEYTGKRLQNRIFRRILGEERRTVTMSRCTKLFSRDLIVNNMQYCDPKIRMGEDITITMPAILDSDRVVILRDATYYHYRYVDSSMVHQYDETLDEGIRNLVHLIRSSLERKFRGEKLAAMKVTEDEIAGMSEREHILLFQLQLRNAFRYQGRDCVERIRNLCIREGIPQITAQYPIHIKSFGKRVLYAIEKRPSAWRIRLILGIVRMRR